MNIAYYYRDWSLSECSARRLTNVTAVGSLWSGVTCVHLPDLARQFEALSSTIEHAMSQIWADTEWLDTSLDPVMRKEGIRISDIFHHCT